MSGKPGTHPRRVVPQASRQTVGAGVHDQTITAISRLLPNGERLRGLRAGHREAAPVSFYARASSVFSLFRGRNSMAAGVPAGPTVPVCSRWG
jgi:hypothetical protein